MLPVYFWRRQLLPYGFARQYITLYYPLFNISYLHQRWETSHALPAWQNEWSKAFPPINNTSLNLCLTSYLPDRLVTLVLSVLNGNKNGTPTITRGILFNLIVSLWPHCCTGIHHDQNQTGSDDIFRQVFMQSGHVSPRDTTTPVNTNHLYNICTRWTNVEDVGPTLYKCFTNVLWLLGC